MATILPAVPGAAPPDTDQHGSLDDLAAELHQRAKAAGVDPTALLDALARKTYGERHDTPDEETVQVDDGVRQLLDRFPLPPSQRQLVGGFLTAKSNANTRTAYLGDVQMFLDWLLEEQGHADLGRVRRMTAMSYAGWLERKNYAAKTRARRVSTLSALWASDDPDLPLLGRTPWGGLSAGATTETTTGFIPLDKIGAVVDAADRDGLATGMLFRLSIWCGLRISESVKLRLADLDDNGDGAIANVRVKGGRRRKVWLPSETCDMLARWLEHRATLGTGAQELLVDEAGEPLGRHPATWRIHKVTRSVLGEGLNPHALRKTGAILLWRAGTKPDGSPVSFEDLRRHGGWQSLETIKSYVEAAEEAHGTPSLYLEELAARFADSDEHADRRLDDTTRRTLTEQVKAAAEAAKAPRRPALTR